MDTIKVNSGKTRMIAHRGASALESENTNAAFVAAGNRTYFGIETDVHVTADGKFAVFHDDETKRMSDADIKIESSTYDDLRKIPLYDMEKGRYRSNRLSQCKDEIFYQLVNKLAELKEINFEHLFVDGTKIEANANKYSFVWKKSTNKYEARLLEKLEKYGWEFLFLGANIDAVSTAAGFGISADRAVTYEADSVGTRMNFNAVSQVVGCVRNCAPIAGNWKENIERHRDKKRK